MVTINNNLAGLAFVNTNRQWHFLPVTTMRAILRCVTWIHFLKLTASIFSFAFEYSEEGRPCNIRDCFGKVMVFDHPFDVQVFDGDYVKLLDKLRRFFVVKIFARSADLQVSERDFLPGFSAIGGAFLLARKSTLKFGQILRSVGQMARVFYMLAIAQRGETLNPNINANIKTSLWQRFRLRQFADQQNIPAISAARNSQLLNFAFDWTAQANPTRANTGNGQLVATQRASSPCFKFLTEGMVAVTPFEARESGLASTFLDSLKERLESFINSFQCIALNSPHVRLQLWQGAGIRQMAALIVEVEALTSHLVAVDSLRKRGIVDLARMLKLAQTSFDKLRVSANLVFKSLDECDTTLVSHCVSCLPQDALWLGQVGSSNFLLDWLQSTTISQIKHQQFGTECGHARDILMRSPVSIPLYFTAEGGGSNPAHSRAGILRGNSMTTRTRQLICDLIRTARIIAATVEQYNPLRAAEELLRAWQLETMLASGGRLAV